MSRPIRHEERYAYQPTEREVKRKTNQGRGKKSGAINVTFGIDKFPEMEKAIQRMVEREKGKRDPRLDIDDGPVGGGRRGGEREVPQPKLAVMPKRGWWNEPKKEYRPEKSAKDRRMELLTGGTGTGGSSSDSDRQSLLTGRGLSSNEDRMSMLTGRSDPPKEKWKSQYGGREEYDPQDRTFNNQFSEAPKGPQPWDSPSKPVSSPSSPAANAGPGFSPNTSQGYDDSSVRERLRALEGRPQSTGGGWQEDRIAALENRKPIVNQSTVDLSGIQGRLTDLEGKGSSWQEDRIKQLEGRKPQDLSGIHGQLTALGGAQSASDKTSTAARSALSDRLTSLENYYKNDPPAAESTGNRYEDKMASLAKGWDMTDKATKWDPEDDRLAGYINVRDQSGKTWANTLEEGYVQGVRDLNREYNKPVHTANIKGREYKAYDPKAAARLRYLDDQNIHEDTYLGQGTWQNQYGDDVRGWDRGDQDRYFTSQSGLDKDSDEYKKRFGSHFSGSVGKDYAWYQ
mgnify:CR=1 FL=1